MPTCIFVKIFRPVRDAGRLRGLGTNMADQLSKRRSWPRRALCG